MHFLQLPLSLEESFLPLSMCHGLTPALTIGVALYIAYEALANY